MFTITNEEMSICEGIPNEGILEEIIKGKSYLKHNVKVETDTDIIKKNSLSILCLLSTTSPRNKEFSSTYQPYYQTLTSYEESGSTTGITKTT